MLSLYIYMYKYYLQNLEKYMNGKRENNKTVLYKFSISVIVMP